MDSSFFFISLGSLSTEVLIVSGASACPNDPLEEMPYLRHILSGIAGMTHPSPTIAVCLPSLMKVHQHSQTDLGRYIIMLFCLQI
jgi:hypothetical protein